MRKESLLTIACVPLWFSWLTNSTNPNSIENKNLQANPSLLLIHRTNCRFASCVLDSRGSSSSHQKKYAALAANANAQLYKWILFSVYFTNLQADDNISDSYLSNISAHHPSHAELFAHVNIHDVQRVAVSSCGRRCCHWLFHVWMEEICNRRCHRALSLDAANPSEHTMIDLLLIISVRIYIYEKKGIDNRNRFK